MRRFILIPVLCCAMMASERLCPYDFRTRQGFERGHNSGLCLKKVLFCVYSHKNPVTGVIFFLTSCADILNGSAFRSRDPILTRIIRSESIGIRG